MLLLPESLREVNIVVVRILKSEHFVPKSVNLLLAVFLCFVESLEFIEAFAACENGLEQFFDCIVFKCFLFPGEIRVKEGERSGEINDFIGECY